MTGFCPGGTREPECHTGPKWTSNDPMFFLHHAMSSLASPFVSTIDSPFLQIDNAASFMGGSVPARETFAIYRAFPNGGPPFLNVNKARPRVSHYLPLVTHTVRVRVAQRRIVGQCDNLRGDGHKERSPLLHLRVIASPVLTPSPLPGN